MTGVLVVRVWRLVDRFWLRDFGVGFVGCVILVREFRLSEFGVWCGFLAARV